MTENATPEQPGEGAPDGRLSGLAAAIGGLAGKGPAPVHLWNPPFCGDIAMRIAADGTWFYDGTPITRPALVRLFASVLRKDPERFVLVTPVERVGIVVDDAPFAAVAMEEASGELRFVTNLGETVVVDGDHPLRFTTAEDGGIKPYVLVRGGLWARLTRSLAIELLDRLEERDGVASIRSGDRWFAVG